MNIHVPVPGNFSGIPWVRKKNQIHVRKYETRGDACWWIVVLISLVIITTLFPAVVTADSSMPRVEGVNPGDDAIVWGPYLTDTTHNSTVIHWKTSGPSVGRIGFSLNGIDPPGISSRSVPEENPSILHQVQLDNLEPGQRYSYWIGNNSQNYSFSTFPTDGSFTFVVYGDTREQLPLWNQSDLHARVAERIAMEQDCLFVVHTGDLVNDPDDEGEWGRFFEAAGAMLASTTFFAVPGNHEGDLLKYQEYFGVPPWYNFTVSGFEFIIIDSNTLKPDREEQQNRWINQTLAGPSNGRFVFLHHPMYTSEPNHWGGFLDIRGKWEQPFIEHNVIVVFSAHVHAYEHFYENGIDYLTMGTGGAPFYPLAEQKPAGYRNSTENTLAYARVTVSAKPDPTLVEVIKVAEIRDGRIIMSPPGTIIERVLIPQPIGKPVDMWVNLFSSFHPLFKSKILLFPYN